MGGGRTGRPLWASENIQVTIIWFTVFTFLSGFTNSFPQLLFTRTMQGIGFGGEWSVGSVLIAEMIRPEHRGKAVGLVQSSWAVGWGVAAIAYAVAYSVLEPGLAWRVLFWIGIPPALLVVFIRRYVKSRRCSRTPVPKWRRREPAHLFWKYSLPLF